MKKELKALLKEIAIACFTGLMIILLFSLIENLLYLLRWLGVIEWDS